MNPYLKKDHKITARELMDKQANDPEYQKKLNDLKNHRQQATYEFMQAAAPIFEELSKTGFNIASFSDLYRIKDFANKTTYRQVLPILLKWLPQIEDLRVKESIVRALSIKWAKPIAAPTLIKEFIQITDSENQCKWAIGNALSVVADDSVFEEIVELVQEKEHGVARQMVEVALGNMKDPRAVDVLLELLHDDQVAGHAIFALGKIKSFKARPYIEPFLNNDKSWVRKEAKRALEKINKVNS